METKIIALNCPSCGNSGSISGKDLRFGFHFTCGYCGTHSILVINQELYVPKPQEHVCPQCGRVARPGARFCQCRSSLVRSCWHCHAEIPIDDEVCDRCGKARMDYEKSDDKLLMDCVEEEMRASKSEKEKGPT